jgi:hypothetical protein
LLTEVSFSGDSASTAEQPMRPANSNAPVERRERLGGLLNFYYHRAA